MNEPFLGSCHRRRVLLPALVLVSLLQRPLSEALNHRTKHVQTAVHNQFFKHCFQTSFMNRRLFAASVQSVARPWAPGRGWRPAVFCGWGSSAGS